MWSVAKRWLLHTWLHPRYLAHRELYNIMALEMPRLKGRLLDVGCGRRPYAELAIGVQEYVGLDMPTTMHGTNRVDVLGSAVSLPFDNCVFDSLVCTEVLEHVPEPALALQEFVRVMRPGGVMVLTVPLSEQLHEEPHDYYRFTRHSLQHLLQQCGLRIQTIYERGGAWLEISYRTSSLLYSWMGATVEPSGSLKPRLLLGPVTVLLCTIIQLLGAVVNRIWLVPLSTIGYGVVAIKED